MISRVRVKICGIASQREADLAVRAGADLIGLAESGPGGPVRDADLAAATPPGVDSVLLSSETDPDRLADHALRCRPAAVQLRSAPRSGAVEALRAALPGVRVIRMVTVEDAGALDAAREAASGPERPDALLLETVHTARGGRTAAGRVPDWTLARRVIEASPLPVFIAGGLRPDSVGHALRAARPYGIDLRSAVRNCDGRLDAGRLGALMAAIRAAG